MTVTEIKLGQSTPLSGPASAFGAGAGRAVVGFFEQGGINCRKINFTQLDNAYSAPKAVEQLRKLVNDVGILAEVGTIGIVPNVAIQTFFEFEARAAIVHYGRRRSLQRSEDLSLDRAALPGLRNRRPCHRQISARLQAEAKIGVLYQNDDFGKDYLKGLRDGLGSKASQILIAISYELFDPTIDLEILQLKAAGIDTVIEHSSAKATAQSIRKIHELGWSPLHVIGGSAASVETVSKTAGLDASKGVGHRRGDQGLQEFFLRHMRHL